MISINELKIAQAMKNKGYTWTMVFDNYDPLYVKTITIVVSLLENLPPKAIFPINSFINYLETNTL